MNPTAEIFSQGAEVVCGQIVDSNAAWLAQELTELGFCVTRHTAVGDDLAALAALMREIAARADCCICTGGLGPTSDDLTAQAVSLACGTPLVLDEIALAQIERFFQRRKYPMPDVNRKQAYLPAGALRIDNIHGSAPGFMLQYLRCRFVFLPGVPMEMKSMFGAQVQALLAVGFSLQPDKRVTLRSIGIGESAIQQRLTALALPPEVLLGFRATLDEVQTKLLFPASFPEEPLQALTEQTAALIGDYVYAIDYPAAVQGDLLNVLQTLLTASAQTLTVLETYSHGLVAAKCAMQPWLNSAHVCLNLAQVAEKTGVDYAGDDLNAYARQIALALKHGNGSDLALVQLYESNAGSEHDEAIVLYNALCCADDTVHSSWRTLAGIYSFKQNQAAWLTLDLLRRYLQHKCL
ncbi:MAG: molybdopterin-binding protein [Methylomonas sp.]|jgi:competence/damage-inducible protein CinA-like protein